MWSALGGWDGQSASEALGMAMRAGARSRRVGVGRGGRLYIVALAQGRCRTRWLDE